MNDNDIYTPRLYGKTIYEWNRILGPCTIKDIKEFISKQIEINFDEERIDIVGSNGNEGLHYKCDCGEK